MELYFWDAARKAISPPMDTATSVVWSLRLGECGTFAVELPLTMGAYKAAYTSGELLSLATAAAYLCDRQYCGRIESVVCRDHVLRIEGRLLACLLYDRVASADTVYTGTVGQVVRQAVTDWAGDMGLTLPTSISIGEDTVQVTLSRGTSLGKWLHALLLPYGAGYTIEMTEDDGLAFGVYVGVDRSLDSGPGVSRAIFSEDFGNIAGLETEVYRSAVLERLYVEGSDGTLVQAETTGPHSWRRESYVKAADIRPSQFDTTAAYQAALQARGKALLAGKQEITRLTCMGEHAALPRYGTDYRLGDICEIQSDTLGIRCALRLTAVDVVYEGGTVKLYPFFGGTVDRVRTILY